MTRSASKSEALDIVWDEALCEPYPSSLGGKTLGLLRIRQHGLKVPRFCVLMPDADPELAVEALKAFNGSAVAVRSSAEAEDGQHASFAGMYETVLGVRTADELRAAIAHCRQSTQSERLQAYRAQHNLPDSPLAIIIQALVEGEVSGVLFSHDPIMPERTLISAAYGLGEGVVQGTAPCEYFWVYQQHKIEKQLSTKIKRSGLSMEKLLGRIQWRAPRRPLLERGLYPPLGQARTAIGGGVWGPTRYRVDISGR